MDNITRDHAIILVTIPISGMFIHPTCVLLLFLVTDDMENQMAVRLARDADPNGERTLGWTIITSHKPDG